MRIVGLLVGLLLMSGATAAFAALQWDDFATSGYCPGTMRKVANVANCGCRADAAHRISPTVNCRPGGGGGRGGGWGRRGARRFQPEREIPDDH